MTSIAPAKLTLRSLLITSALTVGAALAPQAAQAGQCPAGKSGENLLQPNTTPAKGVTDTVLSAITLANEPVGIKDRKFRLRRLVIQPGGVVPWHSHADRPALIYVVSGTIVEYSSACAVPIVHRAGEVAAETHVTAHWWRNTGTVPCVLLSADLLHEGDNEHMM